MKKIALIGCTGSIGKQVLNVVRRFPEKFQIVSLAAGSNSGLFIGQVDEFRPKVATISTELNDEYVPPLGVELFQGKEDAFINAIIKEADVVVVALVGCIGLKAVLKAIELGKDIALANKESLVCGGDIVMKAVREKRINIFPVDSEHSAIWQALDFDYNKPFKNLILTASGGAFRDFTKEQLQVVTARDALKHPTWNMGSKITVDCATMVNKAFEVAEAHHLYNADFEKIKVVIHRESIIHSMVEYADGSVIAQMSYPSMELPIQIALSYPERLSWNFKSLNLAEIGKLSFNEVDTEKYPCFAVALEAIKKGGLYPAVLTAANDRAVRAFLSGEISFGDVRKIIDSALNGFKNNADVTLDGINEAINFGTETAQSFIRK